MKTTKTKSLSKPIILIQILEDSTLLVVDSETTIRFFDKNTLELKGGFKVGIKHKYYKNSVVAYSHDAKYLATLTADAKESRLYSTETKKLIGKVDRHHGEASCVGIDPQSRYMFSCGDDGKIFAIDTRSSRLVFTLPAHIDTVTDIAFSKNSNWVATSSYDRKISLLNLVTMSPKDKLVAHSAPVMKLKFFHKQNLVSIDKKSRAIIWDIYTGKVVKRLDGIHDDVTQITISDDEKFLFLGTALGYVMVYDLETFEQISRNYIKIVSPITALEFDGENNELIVGTQDGFLMFYEIYKGEEVIKELLQYKAFEKIQKEVEKNPLLTYTKIYEVVSNLWEITLKRAKQYLQNSEKEKALRLFSQFKDIPSKNTIIQKTLRDYEEFEKFAKFAKEGKIALAYALANVYPVYKESKLYKQMELRWKKVFMVAQKYALDPRSMDKARELLQPYRGISEKTAHIQELFTQGDIYKRFKSAIWQKDFKIAFELIKQHPFLTEFTEYDALVKYGDSLYIKAQKYMQDGDMHSAVKLLRSLVNFSEFSQEAKEMLRDVEAYQHFFNAVEEEDMQLAYKLLDSLDNLMDTPDGQKLQEQWNADFNKAKLYASKGDVLALKQVLEPYISISSKNISLASVFGLCYIVQLEKALKEKEEQRVLEHGIKNYILYFGVDERIEAFFDMFKKHYPQTKLNLELQTKGSVNMWKPAMIVNSILE